MAQKRHATAVDYSHRFIADTHFGHSLMIRPRTGPDGELLEPFRKHADIRDHDEALVAGWNKVVKPGDTVWHLGDFGYGDPDDLKKIFRRLNGTKHLLAGNHDDPATVANLDFGWASVSFGPVHFKDSVSGMKFVGFHWPLREWDGWHKASVHLHGHTHGSLPSGRRTIDVGVDNLGAEPNTFTDILSTMRHLPELDFVGVPCEPFVPGRK